MAHAYGLDAAGEALVAGPLAKAKAVAAANAASVDAERRFPLEAMAALGEQGLLGISVPKEHGGLGLGPAAFCAAAEELGAACASTAMVFVMHVSATAAIAASPTLAGKADLLRSIAKGKHLTTLAFSEKGSRSHFWAPMSKLKENGRGYVTSAKKSWVTSAAHADSYVSSAQAPNAASPMESTLYLVRRTAKGVGPAGGFEGLGLRGNDSTPVDLVDVAVSRDDLLTPPGKGADAMLQVVLPWFALGTSGMSNGLCRSALGATLDHVSKTAFEHLGSALRDLPTMRARVAKMSVTTEQSRAMLGRTLAAMGAGAADTPLLVLQSRLAALDAALDVTDGAMKACGGAAFSRHLPLERTFRDARAGWVMAPTADHLQEFVGRALTGLPLFG